MVMMKITVAFVDDHPVLLSGMSQLFSSSDRFQVVGVGRTANDLVELAVNAAPDVLVVDLSMPGNTVEAIHKVATVKPTCRILAFTASQSIDLAVSVLEAGATGYALKGISLEELSDAIARVHEGETYITPSFAAKVVVALRNSARNQSAPRIVFSRREEQVLRLLLNGRTNREIADAMNISEKTVKHYMSVLMQKLNARNRLEVVLAAQSLGDLGAGRSSVMN